MKKIKFSILLLVVGCSFLLFSCGKEGAKKISGTEVIDVMGRTVTIPDSIENGIVTVGSSGPLRFLSIFDVYDYVIQVDKGDVTDNKNGRAYSYAFPYDKFTPDMYHPDNKLESETVEQIGAKNPSLIIVQQSVYNSYTENCEILASRFPLIVIPQQSMTELWTEDYKLADWYVQTVELIGTAIGKPGVAAKHISDVNKIISDIRSYVRKSDKRVYVAGLTWMGSNELTTTFPTYLPLMLVDGINAHGGDEKTRVEMDPEYVTGIKMDYFVIDPSSADKLSTPNSQIILEWLYINNNDGNPETDIKVYATLPMVWDSANYDCVLAGSYFLAHLLYGTLDIKEVEGKVNTVFTTYYGDKGKNVFADMTAFFEKKSSDNNVDLPPLSEVKIIRSGNRFSIQAI